MSEFHIHVHRQVVGSHSHFALLEIDRHIRPDKLELCTVPKDENEIYALVWIGGRESVLDAGPVPRMMAKLTVQNSVFIERSDG